MKRLTVGILSFQGAVQDHFRHIENCGARSCEVRSPGDLKKCDRLIIPGGESSVIEKFIDYYEMVDPLKEYISQGHPVWGICAGAICLSEQVDGRKGILPFVNVKTVRNAYGRQLSSFTASLEGAANFEGHFIRAPRFTFPGKECRVLLLNQGDPVHIRQGMVQITSFHPELGFDSVFHREFISLSI